jgi:NitT/TauT family transport system permease protein
MLERSARHAESEAAEAARPVAFRGAGFAPRASRHAGWIALAAVIALWQLLGSLSLVNPIFLPTPSAILRAIYQLAASGALWHHLSASLMRITAGWMLGTVAGLRSDLRSVCSATRAASASPSSQRCFRSRRSRCCRS